jgi:D-sedoheptulose 7-phosphate isomerase
MRISFDRRIEACRGALQSVAQNRELISTATEALSSALHAGKRVYACGNGGSAAEAMHFATELSGRYRSNRVAFPAMALTADGTALTCIGNDFGWEQIFARQLEAHAEAGDVLVALSTSGNSPNVTAALEVARRLGVTTIGLLGKGGGAALPLCDIPIVIASEDTGAIQEAHLVVIHLLCEGMEPEEENAEMQKS